ncbi:cyclic lactone autoinducer peptide [Listeria sp. PSOL-1]|uniref:cyclic lactone autoinducer peptide n=1 Tax=Listeria sp. PSOL-1 TaxID=1844999 RepID=UPI0013D61254|nr:cyclic lactone autoinducer peptide [Listeria sp. PSOL-1]
MNKNFKDYLMEKIEKKSMEIAEVSSRKSCLAFTYEPSHPCIKMQEKQNKQ